MDESISKDCIRLLDLQEMIGKRIDDKEFEILSLIINQNEFGLTSYEEIFRFFACN